MRLTFTIPLFSKAQVIFDAQSFLFTIIINDLCKLWQIPMRRWHLVNANTLRSLRDDFHTLIFGLILSIHILSSFFSVLLDSHLKNAKFNYTYTPKTIKKLKDSTERQARERSREDKYNLRCFSHWQRWTKNFIINTRHYHIHFWASVGWRCSTRRRRCRPNQVMRNVNF